MSEDHEGAARAASGNIMQASMEALVKVFPDCAVVLLVAPFGAPPNARVNYVANAERQDILILLREVVARFEGRAHDAPKSRQ